MISSTNKIRITFVATLGCIIVCNDLLRIIFFRFGFGFGFGFIDL